MTDFLTVLSTNKKALAKTWVTQTHIESYTGAKYFKVKEVRVSDLRSLSAVLVSLQTTYTSGVVRGQWKGQEIADLEVDPERPRGTTRRCKDTFLDTPHHWLMIDVDKFIPEGVRPYDEVERAACQFIDGFLPESFRDVNFHWQLSSSAGKELDVLKIHLWFWLETPYTSAQIRSWAINNPNIDIAVYDPVQWHYTANPMFYPGVKDPVSVRSGLYLKNKYDVVDLVIKSSGAVSATRLDKLEAVKINDPISKKLFALGLILNFRKDGALNITCPFNEDHTVESDETSTVFYLPHTGGFVEGAFVCKHSHCKNKEQYEFLEKLGLPLPSFDFENLGPPEVVNKEEKKKRKAPEREALLTALKYPESYGMVIKYDEFTAEVQMKHVHAKEFVPFQDECYDKIAIELEKGDQGFRTIPHQMMQRIITLWAKNNSYDAALDWLISLPMWDGTHRVDGFLAECFGVIDNDYSRAVSRYIWSALAARIVDPGCQADMVPIAVGRQGTYKSRSVMAMCPPRWFKKMDLTSRNEDLIRLLKGALVIELDEMQGINAKDVEHIKALVTRTEDIHIPKYMEKAAHYKRRAFFFGTANKDDILLKDPTGQRRWLPFRATKCDPQKISDTRDQLWAEGLAIYRNKGVAWKQAEMLAVKEHSKFQVDDPWDDVIYSWLDEKRDYSAEELNGDLPFTLNEVTAHALGVENKILNATHKNRVILILSKIQYVRVKRVVNGRRVTVFVRKDRMEKDDYEILG